MTHALLSIYDYLVISHLFQFFGAAVLGVGIWILVDEDVQAYFEILDTAVDSNLGEIIAYICIGFGSFLLIVCLFGCLGACCKNTCMLTTVSN